MLRATGKLQFFKLVFSDDELSSTGVFLPDVYPNRCFPSSHVSHNHKRVAFPPPIFYPFEKVLTFNFLFRKITNPLLDAMHPFSTHQNKCKSLAPNNRINVKGKKFLTSQCANCSNRIVCIHMCVKMFGGSLNFEFSLIAICT
ncbi:hypothetical protein POVWA2_014280 [Plasmodium ovale wallikeri]|uniref:Uncharacterized protein n=1 Tax=Plasmodium ovale wallikeri TaxID=864142 RepID=A0A1A8YMU1_PLAOA|nr:hypothetical protein POVWA1_014440 [Plasmodium ovale wallikeri]SBT33349.1 hypothetical protein POVWA2_014280 [Plasmodium ovale wallikeri]